MAFPQSLEVTYEIQTFSIPPAPLVKIPIKDLAMNHYPFFSQEIFERFSVPKGGKAIESLVSQTVLESLLQKHKEGKTEQSASLPTIPDTSNLVMAEEIQPTNPSKKRPREVSSAQTTLSKFQFGSISASQHLQYPKLAALSPFQRTKEDEHIIQTIEQETFKFRNEQRMRIFNEVPNPYLSLIQSVRTISEMILSERLKRLSQYAKNYKPLVPSLKLTEVTTSPDDPTLLFEKQIEAFGNVYFYFHIPRGIKLSLLSEAYQPIADDEMEAFPSFIPPPNWAKQPEKVVSSDSDLTELIKRHNVNFVLSSSTFRALIKNIPPFYEGWHIPVVVRYVDGKKVCFLDKPLPKRRYTVEELNQIYYRLAHKWAALSKSKQPHVLSTTPREKLSKWKNMTYNLFKFGEYLVLIRCKFDAVISEPVPETKSQTPSYSLQSSEPSIPGSETFQSSPVTNTPIHFIGIRSKPEYFLSEGLSELSQSEQADYWAYSVVRPQLSYIALARVNVRNQQLDRTERLNISGFHAGLSMKIVHEIFKNILSGLDLGAYMLTHESHAESVHLWGPKIGSVDPSESILSLDPQGFGQLDLETIGPISHFWNSRPGRIPFTYLPKLVDQVSQFRYCHLYANQGFCKSPATCHFFHYTAEESTAIKEYLEQKKEILETQKKEKGKETRKKRKKKKKALHDQTKQPQEQHTQQDEPQRQVVQYDLDPWALSK